MDDKIIEVNTTVENYFRTPGDLLSYTFYGKARYFKYHSAVTDRASEANFNDVLKLADEILLDVNDSSMRSAVFLYGEVICKIYYFSGDGNYSWHVASDDHAKMKSLEEKLLAAIPIITADEGRVPLTFWTLGARGATSRNRRIVVPDWPDIRQNYPAEVGDSLSQLMEMKPGKSGQLIMFHGVPGTGKSYAIRALLKQWNSWCKGEYIVDPEKFFGGSAEYMISVLLGNDNSSYDVPASTDGQSSEGPKKSPWHLYIVEDSDELLTDDAKQRSGQALSRLLNVVDGMIGQGLQVLVLVTTNEPMARIHPAIKRPGRCLANIEFRKFNKQEAREWVSTAKNQNPNITEDKTLAELYHERRDDKSLQLESDKPGIGFE